MKEYGELLEHDAAYADKARRFSVLLKDVNEFLASIGLNLNLRALRYSDLPGFLPSGPWPEDALRSTQAASIRSQPGVKEMALSDLCCGSAGIYNIIHTNMAMAVLRKKWPPSNRPALK